MRFLLAIYANERTDAARTEAEASANMAHWFTFTDELRTSGAMLAGDALLPTATARTVRLDAGRPVVSDGPFAETKEQLGGYYLIEAKDIDAATAWAAKMPNLPGGGSVEVRPVMDFE